MGVSWKHGECLITGGAGYLGSHLVKGLLAKYDDIKIRVLYRSGNELTALMSSCQNDGRIIPIMGDIRNSDLLHWALRDVSTVVHLAALKHIDLCEDNPTEAVNTNVLAAMDLLNAFEGNTLISMSTDKAAAPTGCYGATKLLLEKLTLEKARRYPDRRYMVIRSGNIFGSAGSVIPKWLTQIRQTNKITITDLGITRFFISPSLLVASMMTVLEEGMSGRVYIPPQTIVTLQDLSTAVIDVYGNAKTKLEVLGLREGEKKHERLFFKEEKNIVTISDFETSDVGSPQSENPNLTHIKAWLKEYAEDTGTGIMVTDWRRILGKGAQA